MRQLRRQFGDLPADLEAVIRQLPPTQIEILAEALLEFATLEDLRGWLRNSVGDNPPLVKTCKQA
ncbi:MAG: DUF4351 domain-containing protein [Thermosynechococcus sp.]